MSNEYDDLGSTTLNNDPNDRSEHVTKAELRQNQIDVRNAAREKQKIDREWAKGISQLDVETLLELRRTLPLNDKRCINNTSTVSRREAVILNLAKNLSGKSIRMILVEACEQIIKEKIDK